MEFDDDFDEDFDQTSSLSTQGRFPENLIRVRSEAGDRSFLVRWEGYDERSDSWVHESALPSRMVDEFDWGMCGVSVPQRDVEQREFDTLEFDILPTESEDEDYTPFVYTPLSPEDLEREIRMLNEKFQASPPVSSECVTKVCVGEKSVEVSAKSVEVTKSVEVSVKSVEVSVVVLSTSVSPSLPPKPLKVGQKLKKPPRPLPSPLILTELERLELHTSLSHFLWLSKVKRFNPVCFRPPKPPRPPPDPYDVSFSVSSTSLSSSSQLLGTFILDRSSVVNMENQCGFLALLLYTLFSPTTPPPPDLQPLSFACSSSCP